MRASELVRVEISFADVRLKDSNDIFRALLNEFSDRYDEPPFPASIPSSNVPLFRLSSTCGEWNVDGTKVQLRSVWNEKEAACKGPIWDKVEECFAPLAAAISIVGDVAIHGIQFIVKRFVECPSSQAIVMPFLMDDLIQFMPPEDAAGVNSNIAGPADRVFEGKATSGVIVQQDINTLESQGRQCAADELRDILKHAAAVFEEITERHFK